MNFEEIKKRLEELEVSNDDFGYGDFPQDDEQLGPWTEVDQHGGEGEGGSYHTVKHFTKHDVYIRLDGFYTSYDGTDFSDYELQEVKPQQKTITVYE